MHKLIYNMKIFLFHYLSTFSLFLFPGLDCKFVLLILIAPVRVNFLIVCSFVWGAAAVGVHGDVVAGDQLALVHTVVPPRVLLADGDDHQALLAGDDVLLRGEVDGVPPLALAIVVPLHLGPGVAACHLELTQGTGEVNTLTKVCHQLPLEQ